MVYDCLRSQILSRTILFLFLSIKLHSKNLHFSLQKLSNEQWDWHVLPFGFWIWLFFIYLLIYLLFLCLIVVKDEYFSGVFKLGLLPLQVEDSSIIFFSFWLLVSDLHYFLIIVIYYYFHMWCVELDHGWIRIWIHRLMSWM